MLAISLASFVVSSSILIIITLLLIFVTYQTFYSLCLPPIREDKTSSKSSISNISRSQINYRESVTQSQTNVNRQIRERRSKIKIKAFFKYSTLISSTCFLLSSILITTERILSIEPFWTFGHLEYFSYFMNTLYFIGRMILTSIFIGRLYYTFRESSFYKLSLGTLQCMTVLWFLSCCVGLLASALYPLSVIYTIIFGTLFLFLDGLLSCVLMYIYVKKLRLLVNKNNENANVKLISLITRYTLLYSLCFTSTTIYFVAAIIISTYGRSVFPPGESQRLLSLFLSADSLCNALSLWLNLSYAKKWYNRLCNAAHHKCNLCFGITASDNFQLSRIASASPDAPRLPPINEQVYAASSNTVDSIPSKAKLATAVSL